jgi:enamine deaminase RidA (YjgF/YER057c/UK114 family)
LSSALNGIKSNVVQALGNSISDDVQIKVLVKDSNDESSNKYKEIYSYKIDKFNFMKKPTPEKPVVAEAVIAPVEN